MTPLTVGAASLWSRSANTITSKESIGTQHPLRSRNPPEVRFQKSNLPQSISIRCWNDFAQKGYTTDTAIAEEIGTECEDSTGIGTVASIG